MKEKRRYEIYRKYEFNRKNEYMPFEQGSNEFELMQEKNRK